MLAVEMGGDLKDGVSVVYGLSFDKESEDRVVAAVIRGIIKSLHTNHEYRNVGEIASYTPSHGSPHVRAVVGSVAGSVHSHGSSMTFDPLI